MKLLSEMTNQDPRDDWYQVDGLDIELQPQDPPVRPLPRLRVISTAEELPALALHGWMAFHQTRAFRENTEIASTLRKVGEVVRQNCAAEHRVRPGTNHPSK